MKKTIMALILGLVGLVCSKVESGQILVYVGGSVRGPYDIGIRSHTIGGGSPFVIWDNLWNNTCADQVDYKLEPYYTFVPDEVGCKSALLSSTWDLMLRSHNLEGATWYPVITFNLDQANELEIEGMCKNGPPYVGSLDVTLPQVVGLGCQ